MKVGLIGLGKMGSIHKRVLDDLQAEGLVSEVKCYDTKNWEQYLSVEALLDWADCFIIATPTDTHKHYVDMCLATGKPTFCEKPFTSDYNAEVDAYRKYATPPNTQLRIGYIERYNAAIDRFKDLIYEAICDASDALLLVKMARVSSVDIRSMKGREIVTDLGIHDYDMIHQIFGKYKVKSSMVITHNGAAIHAESEFTLLNSVPCKSVVSWIDTEKRRVYTVYTKKSVITVDLLTQTVTATRRSNHRKDVYVEKVEPAYREIKAFILHTKGVGGHYSNLDPVGLYAQAVASEILKISEVIAI